MLKAICLLRHNHGEMHSACINMFVIIMKYSIQEYCLLLCHTHSCRLRCLFITVLSHLAQLFVVMTAMSNNELLVIDRRIFSDMPLTYRLSVVIITRTSVTCMYLNSDRSDPGITCHEQKGITLYCNSCNTAGRYTCL
jgi:hypothetical protein